MLTKADEVKRVFMSLPTHENEVRNLILLSSSDIYDIVQEQIVDEPIKNYDLSPAGRLFPSLLSELNKLKNELGGYNCKPPVLNLIDSSRKFFGVPVSAVKDWLYMTVDKKWSPTIFWKTLAKTFKVTKNKSQYEDIHIKIQRFENLFANKQLLIDILDKKDTARYDVFSAITGLAWHPQKNSLGVEKTYIEFVYNYITIGFEEVKLRGTQALIDYFKAFDGVCFENIVKNIEEHARENSLMGLASESNNYYLADWDNRFDWVCK